MADERVNVTHPRYGAHSIPASELEKAQAQGWSVETPEAGLERAKRADADNPVEAFARGALSTLTLGGSDLAQRLAADPEGATEHTRLLREENPKATIAGEVVGGLAPIGAPAAIGGAGGVVSKVLGGKALGTVSRFATEGALFGAGTGVTEAALSDDPLTAEKMVSSIGSNALYGAAVGGAIGAGGVVLKKGAEAAKSLATKAIEKGQITDDLARLDRPALKAAREAEVKTATEAQKVARATVADDLKAHLAQGRESAWWVHSPSKEASKVAFDGSKQLKRLLNAPADVPDRLKSVRTALRYEEEGISKFLEHADEMKSSALEKYGAEAASKSARWKAIDTATAQIESNRALQTKIDDLIKPPSTARLVEIDAALDNLAAGGKPKLGLVGEAIKTGVYGGTMALGSAVGGPFGFGIGALLAGKAADLAEDVLLKRLSGKLAGGAREISDKIGMAVERFANIAEKGQRTAPIVATKVLASASYATPEAVAATPLRPQVPTENPRVKVFREREREILSQTTLGPNGKPAMTYAARKDLHERLAGVALLNPFAADAMETVAARKIEYLADKLPKNPGASMVVGPDRWQPSEMQISSFARTVAAVEDPASIVSRLADGTVTPEDAEALRTVYPEMYADAQRQILEKLPTLRETVPYKQRLAMSILFDMPVDPSMDPGVLAVLQGHFAAEPGTQGGMSPPQPNQPRGTPRSLDKPRQTEQPTPAQTRAG